MEQQKTIGYLNTINYKSNWLFSPYLTVTESDSHGNKKRK